VQHRFVGNTGLKVSELCLGTMTFAMRRTSRPAIRCWTSSSRPAGRSSIRRCLFGRWVGAGVGELAQDHAPRRPGGRDEGVRGDRHRWSVSGTGRKHMLAAVEASLAPARHRLHRPVPDTCVRRRHAHRGDTVHFGYSCQERQGAFSSGPATSPVGSCRSRSISPACTGGSHMSACNPCTTSWIVTPSAS